MGVLFALRVHPTGRCLSALRARAARHSNPFRLPHLSRHVGFEIEVERPESPAKGALREIHIASSIAELAAG